METLAETTPTPTTNYPHLMTVPEVAQYLRVDPATVRKWIDKGALEAIRLPSKTYRIKGNTLDKMLGN